MKQGITLDDQSSIAGSSPASRSKYQNSGLTKTPTTRILAAEEANRMLYDWHYLGPVHGVMFAVGHREGCCVFTNCRSRIYEEKARPLRVIELARMVGKPGHEWAMSSLMAQATREARRRGYDLVVTYSDPYAGHDGMVYRAAGWEFDGIVGKDGHPLIFIDGKRVSPRTLYDRHGTQSVPWLREVYGQRLHTESKPLKSRFIKRLRRQSA